jgi:acyl carrier protein
MTVETHDYKKQLREWIEQRASRKVNGGLLDDTPILERRIISSLQVMELLLFIEKTSGKPINVNHLKPGSFRSVDTIYDTFFAEGTHE